MSKLNLSNVLAETYSLLIKTQGYHWNVTGAQFYGLHKLFEEQYQELFSAIDSIAERIRALGELAPSGLKTYQNLSTLSEPKNDQNAKEMLQDLLQSHEKLEVIIKNSLEHCDSITQGFLEERVFYHQKQIWILKSIISGQSCCFA